MFMNDQVLRLDNRKKILKKHGAKDSQIQNLIDYTKRSFFHDLPKEFVDELFVNSWRSYRGSFEFLRTKIVEWNFPIEKGISSSKEYIKAVEEGILSLEASNSKGLDIKTLNLTIFNTPAGSIPIITLENRSDFEKVIRSFSHSNEPAHVPESMGAATYSGYNNWDRINQYKEQWASINPDYTELDWSKEFSKLINRKHLYKDTFIILSSGPYSNVPADKIGFSEDVWVNLSVDIRKYHESTHYYMKRALGSMKNNALDEILCDYIGIVKTIGSYRKDWAKLFFGLENFPKYRKGGRLENYAEDLNDSELSIVYSLTNSAIDSISEIHDKIDIDPYKFIIGCSYLTLEEIAQHPEMLLEKLEELL
jgi:hypothetical protein